MFYVKNSPCRKQKDNYFCKKFYTLLTLDTTLTMIPSLTRTPGNRISTYATKIE